MYNIAFNSYVWLLFILYFYYFMLFIFVNPIYHWIYIAPTSCRYSWIAKRHYVMWNKACTEEHMEINQSIHWFFYFYHMWILYAYLKAISSTEFLIDLIFFNWLMLIAQRRWPKYFHTHIVYTGHSLSFSLSSPPLLLQIYVCFSVIYKYIYDFMYLCKS